MGEQLFYGGIGLMVLSAVLAVVVFIVLKIRWGKLSRSLDEDYGPEDKA